MLKKWTQQRKLKAEKLFIAEWSSLKRVRKATHWSKKTFLQLGRISLSTVHYNILLRQLAYMIKNALYTTVFIIKLFVKHCK